MRKRRRKDVRSDWVNSLQASRIASALRRETQERSTITGRNIFPQAEPSVGNLRNHPTHQENCHGSDFVAKTTHDSDEDENLPLNESLQDRSDPADGEQIGNYPQINKIIEESEREMSSEVGGVGTPESIRFRIEEIEDAYQSGRSSPDFSEACSNVAVEDEELFGTCSTGFEGTTHSVDIGEAPEPHRDPNIHLLEKRLALWDNELYLTAMLAIVGSVRYTVDQYEYTRGLFADSGLVNTWPSYSKSQKIFKGIVNSCFPESSIVALSTKERRPPGLSSAVDEKEEDDGAIDSEIGASSSWRKRDDTVKEKVRVFMPSSWAKLDVSTCTVFNEMFPVQADETWQETHPLEFSRIVQTRDLVVNSCDYILVRDKDETIPCGHGCLVEVSVIGDSVNVHSSFQIKRNREGYKFKGFITATWCVGALRHINPSAKRAIAIESLSADEKSIITYLSAAPSPSSDAEEGSFHVVPGDICTLLTDCQRSGEAEHLPVILHRFWRYEDGIPSTMLLWIHRSVCRSAENPESIQRGVALKHVVSKLSMNSQNKVLPSYLREQNMTAKCYGELQGGTKYFVYRILLYCDDFQRSSQMNSKGSAGGCYFLALSLPPEARRTTSSVRIISLTPPGVSTNKILCFISDDLVRASTVGVEGRTPAGEKVRIFIDVVGFIGDYPASSGASDVIGHVGRAPCTLCSFRRLQQSETEGSKFGYTTAVHAGNSTFLRQAERHISLRRSGISDSDLNRLGMVEHRRAVSDSSPLVHLQQTLEVRRKDIPRNNQGNLVIPGLFDAYRSNFVAPDHLLTGLSKDILTATFKTLPSDRLRFHFDVRICAALRENGLLSQKEVFNVHKRAIHSMTLSELFCVMLVSVPVLRIITCRLNPDHVACEAALLLSKLQRLIAFTYWWPTPEIDGDDAVRLVHKYKNSYFAQLKRKSKEYVFEVNKLCSRNNDIKALLDKPNLHRLIELYEHTIPAFGHAREFMELVFESAHQPLKRSIARSNNHDAHIFAAENCVGNDWQGRLASLINEKLNGSPSAKAVAKRGIRRLLLGEEADYLEEKQHKLFILRADGVLEKLFTPTLKRQLEKEGRVGNFNLTKTSVWKGRKRAEVESLSRIVGIDQGIMNDIIQLSKRWVQAICPATSTEAGKGKQINLFRTAKRVKVSESGRQIGKPSGFDFLGPNTVGQLYVEHFQKDRKVLVPATDSEGVLSFFAIVAVLQRGEDHAWAISVRCNRIGDKLQLASKLGSSSFQLILLTSSVRRVAIYHACQEENELSMTCSIDEKNKQVLHSSSLLKGGRMYFQRRVNGYPPRMA